MEDPLPTLVRFTDWLLRNSWQASVLIALVLLTQWLFRKQLAPRWRYAFWLLVVARLALPVSPESSVSVFNLALKENFWSDTPASENYPLASAGPASELALSPWPNDQLTNPAVNSAVLSSRPTTIDTVGRAVLSPPVASGAMRTSRPADTTTVNASVVLSIFWLAGALSLAAFTLWFPLRLNRQLANQHSLVNPAVRDVLADCQRVMRVRRVLPVVQSQAINGPALMGFIRPWLLLPEGMLEKFTPEELRFVFLHELAHLKRRDIAVNWLMTFLLILHWFNPLVWFAFARMRADRELACDALALSYANEREAKPYGQTILKLLDGFTRPAAVAGLVGILEDKQQMKRRIAMIAQFKKSSGWPVAAVALIALLGCVSLTDSKKEKDSASNKTKTDLSGTSGGVDAQPVIRRIASEKTDHWVAFGDATPSPNGKYLAYVNWEHGNLAFYNIETGELRDLTKEGTWNPPDQFTFGGIWSPDNTRIAYLWMNGEEGDLRIIHRDGGKPRILVPSDKRGRMNPQVWSRDGRFILGTTFSRPATRTNIHQILLVEVSTGNVRVVKDFPGSTAWVRLSMSPDGGHIAYDFPGGNQLKYMGKDPIPNQIRVVNIDGSGDRVLIDHPADDTTPRWMPDGKHLLFQSDRSGVGAIWALPIQRGEAAGEPHLVRDGLAGGKVLGATDDGSVYYAARSQRFNIFVAPVDFAAGTMETPKLASLRFDGRNRNPCWSADGSKLAYGTHRYPYTSAGIYVVQDAATGKEQDFENPDMIVRARPKWSPDLSRLVAPSWSAGGRNASLVNIDVKSGQRSTLVDKHCVWGVFTTDGTRLIYQYRNAAGATSGSEIAELDLKTKRERVIRKEGCGQSVFLSRDGSHLAHIGWPNYPRKEGDAIKLLITSTVDGATKTVREFASAEEVSPLDWLPDNRRLLVSLMDKQGTQQLLLVDTETMDDRPFGQTLRAAEQIQHLSVHPDGKRVAFESGKEIEEIWTMKNFLPMEKVAAK